jgi:phospholipase C
MTTKLAITISLSMAACGGTTNHATGTTTGAGGHGTASSSSSSSGSSGGGGGAGGGLCQETPPADDPIAQKRTSCTFAAGAKVADTLGLTAAQRSAIPIEHLVIVTEENRSFDHYFGKLSASGQPDAEGPPASFTNLDLSNNVVAPFHLVSTCLPADPGHQWAEMHAGWDNGKMDGFVKSAAMTAPDGHFVIGYYDSQDLPFYYWLANTFAISDRYFGAALGGTWANRDYLYAGTSNGVMNTGQATLTVPTIFDAMDKASVSWGVYTDGTVRQDCLGWTNAHANVGTFNQFLAALTSGTLKSVSFVDPGPTQDEHPPNDVQQGEAWARTIVTTAMASPLWDKLAILWIYDESGGTADHVPPPSACVATPSESAFNNLGIRVPAILISPWARPHYVSHRVHEHDSALRLIEALHDLPALTARDANSDALLDMFDFGCEALRSPPTPPPSGTNGCP